jgi:hypothetical protein
LTRAERAAIPIEDKESYRWVTTLREARQVAQACPETKRLCVADSEADIYEFLAEGMAESGGLRWIVRAAKDRALSEKDGTDAGSERLLRERVMREPVLLIQTIKVRGRRAKIACEKRGRRRPRQSREAEVSVRAAQVILRAPWRKDRKLPDLTKCRVEDRRFEEFDRLLTCLAVYMIIALANAECLPLGKKLS